MQGFVSVLTCIKCGIPTDRKCVCVNCQKRITPYRLRHSGKMYLVFTDGTHLMYITDVTCQRCGANQINDSFDDEGTCYKCQVHNSIMPHVMGQWQFFLYHVTLAPVTTPIKNVIKEMPDGMAKKLVNQMGIYVLEEDNNQKHYQTSSMGDILDNIRKEAGMTRNVMEQYYDMPGIDQHISHVHCLKCGVQVTQVDKRCPNCDTENDIVIQKDIDSGEMYFTNITHVLATGEKRFKKLKRSECPYCNKHPIVSMDLKCSLCNLFIDAKMQQLPSVNDVTSMPRPLYYHEISLHVHRGERPKDALKIIGVPAQQNPTSTPPKSTSFTNRSDALVQQTKTKIHNTPTTQVQQTAPPHRSVPNASSGKPVTARTKRRHTKEQRDAEDKRLRDIARQLNKERRPDGKPKYSERDIAAIITEKAGYKIGRSKVRRWIKKD